MAPRTSRRVETFSESVIRRMTRVANQCGAVNLSQGFPDFDPPEELKAALERAARRGPHQYAVTWGAPEFRQALAVKQGRFTGMEVDPDREIAVTCGSTEAMMASLLAVCDPGDRVIVFSPFYENYGADTILSGAEPLFVPLRPPAFTFDPDELRRAFLTRPKALILCNPSNPTGRVFTAEELTTIAGLAREFDTFVITDEVYEHIVYEPHRHLYLATLPGMAQRTLTCSSLSKTYSITGWRLGYVIGPAGVLEAVRKVHDFLTVGAAAPLQEAAIAGLSLPDAYYQSLREDYRRRRDLFLAGLDEAALTYVRPQGAYYVLVDISRFDRGDDTDFCLWLAREIGVAAVPGSSFFREPEHRYIRLHFAKREETLREAVVRLRRLRDL
jgi:aminotransferase